MTREEAIRKLVNEIMDGFDVQRCLSVMELLNWTWRDDVNPPTEFEFRRSLRNALMTAVEYGGHSSGGFTFTFHDSVDEETGEPFVVFRGGFYVEDVMVYDGVSYTKDRGINK